MEFKIRPFRKSDTARLAKYANNWNISRYLSDQFPYPYSEEDAKTFIERVSKYDPLRSMAITVNDEVVGGIGIHPQDDIHRKNAELGYWVAEPFWGKGIMSKAIGYMLSYGFENFEIERIFARTFADNAASQKVLTRNGLKQEAHLVKTLFKADELHDELIFGIRRDEYEKRAR